MIFKLSDEDRQTIKKLNMRAPSTWLATWFGLGFINPAPGSWGSLGAIPFAVIIYGIGGTVLLGIAIACFFIVGLWAAGEFEKQTETQDNKMIVIDEVAGQWVALLVCNFQPLYVALAFVLFRFFDIVKPWPVSFFDQKIKGSMGVMGDDIVAGLYAALCLIGLQYAGFA